MKHENLQRNWQCKAALDNAHTALHQALKHLQQGDITLSKQKQAQALRDIASSLANL